MIAPSSVEQVEAFDASVYDLPIPVVDGLKADRLKLSLSGAVDLDRTSEDDLAWLESLKLGRDVQLTVTATVVGKPQSFSPSEDGPGVVTLQTSLRVHTVKR